VASTDVLDMTACVGVGIDVGTRFEAEEEKGMSALLKRLLLSSTKSKDGTQTAQELEAMGANVLKSESCKDSIYVAAELLPPFSRDFLALLRESMHSDFSEAELEFQKQSMIFEHEDMMLNAPTLLPELVYFLLYIFFFYFFIFAIR
jgi:predicted Zn-dependent peptidase